MCGVVGAVISIAIRIAVAGAHVIVNVIACFTTLLLLDPLFIF